MRYTNWIACLALGLGMGFTAAADDHGWHRRTGGWERFDLRNVHRDLRHDYAELDELRADIARDRFRLDESIRCGNQFDAARFAGDLARDQRELDMLIADIRHDRAEMYFEPRDLAYDFRDPGMSGFTATFSYGNGGHGYTGSSRNPVVNRGYSSPMVNQGYDNRGFNQGPGIVAPNQTYGNPVVNQGRGNPAANQGYTTPSANQGYSNPGPYQRAGNRDSNSGSNDPRSYPAYRGR